MPARSQLRAVGAETLSAIRAVSRLLLAHEVEHVFVGCIATLAHGWYGVPPDVDVLIQANDAGPLDTLLKPRLIGKHIVAALDGIAIERLLAAPGDDLRTRVLKSRTVIDRLPVPALGAHVEWLLARHYAVDQASVVEILKAGGDRSQCRRHLRRHAPNLLPRFDDLALAADTEPE